MDAAQIYRNYRYAMRQLCAIDVEPDRDLDDVDRQHWLKQCHEMWERYKAATGKCLSFEEDYELGRIQAYEYRYQTLGYSWY